MSIGSLEIKRKKGKKKMVNEKEIVIGILARDCNEQLHINIPRLEVLGSSFKDYHIVIYENDSIDGTTETLLQWAKRNPHVVSINETTNQQTIPEKSIDTPYPGQSVRRISKMANFRNRVLKEVRSRYTPDYFMFIDIDVLDWNPKDVVNSIEKAPKDWGALFGNGQILLDFKTHMCPNPWQYDYYAFVPYNVNPYEQGDFVVHPTENVAICWIEQRLINIKKYHRCNSAFNAIGIYKWEAIEGLEYEAYQTPELKEVNASLCEHVPFNYSVVNRKFKLYIVRDMKTIMRIDKPYVHHGFAKWKDYIPSYSIIKHDPKLRKLIWQGIKNYIFKV